MKMVADWYWLPRTWEGRNSMERPMTQQMFQMLHFGISARETIWRLMEPSLMGNDGTDFPPRNATSDV